MSQVRLNTMDNSAHLPDNGLSQHFSNYGEALAEESALFSAVVSNILASGELLNNKTIILHLIKALEVNDDVVMADVIRKTLEITINHTRDEI